MHTRRTVLSSLASIGICAMPVRADMPYEEKIRQDRAEAAAALKGRNSPFALIAGFNVTDAGVSSFGKDRSCTHVLPAAGSPDHIGEITLTPSQASLRFATGVSALAEGKPVSTVSLETGSSQIAKANVGSLEIRMRWMHPQSPKQNLRVSILDYAFADTKSIQPPVWFPIDKSYQVSGEWVAFPQPKEVHWPDSKGEGRTNKILGYVTFHWKGHGRTLTPTTLADGRFFFVFGDATNGRETYGGGRFLESEAPKNGKVVLDFNEASNPNCAYNHLWNCPLAPKENRLAVPVRAGEMIYPEPLG